MIQFEHLSCCALCGAIVENTVKLCKDCIKVADCCGNGENI